MMLRTRLGAAACFTLALGAILMKGYATAQWQGMLSALQAAATAFGCVLLAQGVQGSRRRFLLTVAFFGLLLLSALPLLSVGLAVASGNGQSIPSSLMGLGFTVGLAAYVRKQMKAQDS